MKTKYLNPYTDFGFKKLFGEIANKDLLMDFLNQLLPDYHQIATLDFKNVEHSSETANERKAIFDIYCQTSDGNRFIMEMQKAKVKFFKNRSLFYSTFLNLENHRHTPQVSYIHYLMQVNYEPRKTNQ